jgi:hypothetical protein
MALPVSVGGEYLEGPVAGFATILVDRHDHAF